jgi:DNA mismatch repair protein MutL
LVEFTETNDFMTLRGYLGKPAMMKRTKNEQFLFLNNRAIQSRYLNHAVTQAYGALLGEREQPFYLMYMTLAPDRFDVNVHPSKMEVRFEDERNVYSMVQAVVKRAVSGMDFSPNVKIEEKPDYISMRESSGQTDSGSQSAYSSGFAGTSKRLSYNDRDAEMNSSNALYRDYKETESRETESRTTSFRDSGTMSNAGSSGQPEYGVLPPSFTENFTTDGTQSGTQSGFESVDKSFEAPSSEEKKNVEYQVILQGDGNRETKQNDARFLWQLHNKYILTQIKTGLMLIDQHVAHERILYERALTVMNSGISNTQQLLFPHRIELKPWEFEIFIAVRRDIEKLGFAMQLFGTKSVLIEGVPPDVRPGTEEKVLHELIEQYQTYRETLELDMRHNIAASYACRNSIMAGDKLSQREMSVLIDQLFATTMPYVCPHGRPIIIKLSLEELDKMFGRT